MRMERKSLQVTIMYWNFICTTSMVLLFWKEENSAKEEKEESDNVLNKDLDIDSTTERLSGNGQETASTKEPVIYVDTSKRKGKNTQPDQVRVYTIKRAVWLTSFPGYLKLCIYSNSIEFEW